jgi:hypothetical protein
VEHIGRIHSPGALKHLKGGSGNGASLYGRFCEGNLDGAFPAGDPGGEIEESSDDGHLS